MLASLRPGLRDAWALLARDGAGALRVGIGVLVAALLSRPLFAVPAAVVRVVATGACLAFVVLDAGAAAVRLSSGHALSPASVTGAIASPGWLAAAPGWLADPWHLAVSAVVLLLVVIAALWLGRLFETAWRAADEAPGWQLVLFVGVAAFLTWAVEQGVPASPSEDPLARWDSG